MVTNTNFEFGFSFGLDLGFVRFGLVLGFSLDIFDNHSLALGKNLKK